MKIIKILLITSVTTILSAPVVLAQSGSEPANITNLMGQRPSNSYYQNPSTSTQTQGTAGVTDSTGASTLQQLPATKLTVEAAPLSTIVAPAKQNSSWKLFTALAAIFFAAAAILFILGMQKQKAALKAEMAKRVAEEAKAEAEAKKAAERTKKSKPKKAHKNNRNVSKAKKRKK